MKNICGRKIDQNKLIVNLFDKELFKKLKVPSSSVSTFIDEIISKGKFDDAVQMITLIQNQIPDYRSFPLIIMNENISAAEKTKALKLVYKQKDFPQYKIYFRDNLSDLNDLDSFIEATIIQNNRVKEKDDNLIKIFKDIFVNGDWRSSNNILSRHLEHKKEFSEKYCEKFKDPVFTRKFYNNVVGCMQTNKWERKNQYEDFLKLIFCSVDIKDQIKIMQDCAELKPLGSSFKTKFSEEFRINDDICKELIKVFAAWAKEDPSVFINSIGKEIFSDVLEYFKDSDCLDSFLSNFKLIDIMRERHVFSEDFKDNILTKIFTTNLLNKTLLFEDDDITNLGFNYEKIIQKLKKKNHSYYSSSYDILTNIEKGMNEFLSALKNSLLSTENTDMKKVLVNKFFERFENSENVDKLVESFMNINADGSTNEMNSWHTKRKTIDVMMDILSQFKNVASLIYASIMKEDLSFEEKRNKFISNIEEGEDTLKIICLAS